MRAIWWVLFAVAVTVVLVPWWQRRQREQRVKKLWSPAHVAHFAKGLRWLTEQAYSARVTGPLAEGVIPPIPSWQSSAHVRVVYSLAILEGQCEHHISVSVDPRLYPPEAGFEMLILTLVLLGVPPDAVQVGISQHGVCHAVLGLSEENLEAWRTNAVRIPNGSAEVLEAMALCEVYKQHVHPETLEVEMPPARSSTD